MKRLFLLNIFTSNGRRNAIWLTGCLSFLLTVALSAQTERYMNLSREYFPPKRGMKILEKNINELNPGTESMWVVFSDRQNNPTYESPGGSAYKQMAFMEPFLVIDETAEYVEIVKYDFAKIDFRKGKIKDAEPYGWVRKDQMLLWRKGLVNPSSGFTLKALTVNRPDILQRLSSYSGEKVLQLYDAPSLAESTQNENDVRLFQFLFILKEEGNALLIAKDEQIDDPDYASKEVLGWVSRDVVSIWDKRLVMEPNFDREAVEERKSKGVKAAIFETQSQARSFQSGSLSEDEALWENPEYNTSPKPAYDKRFPILEENADGTVQTGFITDVFNEDGGVAIKSEEYIKVEAEHNRIREQFRQVNIMFVIDGTTSMKPYFAPIVAAIEASESGFEQSNNDFRLGAVVYRDYPERDCPDGNRMFHVQELTKTYSGVRNFLNSMVEECYDCRDKDKPEAVMLGMKKAIQQFSRYPEQTNIVVLVGDAGNRPTDPETSPEEIAQLLAKYQCSLLAYQVSNGNDPSYTNFIFQANDYITQSSKLIVADMEFGAGIEPRLYKEGKNVRRLKFPEESPVPGSLIHPSRGGQIAPSELQKEIQRLITMINDNQEAVLEGMEGKLKSIGKGPKMNEALYRYLSNLKGVDRDLLEKVSYENLQLFINGYTSLSHSELTHPLYDYQIIVNNYEVFELRQTLDRLSEPLTMDELREALVESYKEILFQHYGKKEGEKKLKTATIGDIMNLVTGLPTKSTLLNQYRLADLESRRKVNEQQLAVIEKYVKDKLRLLEESIVENEQYKFKSNDVTYYWLPQSVLP